MNYFQKDKISHLHACDVGYYNKINSGNNKINQSIKKYHWRKNAQNGFYILIHIRKIS